MSVNHHLLAKATTDAVLSRFKSQTWKCCNNIGVDFYRVGCESTFPSPDAAFYDEGNKILVSFEFKPPTESKRGILTGLGQAIAYLKSSNLSYLIVPQKLDDFEIGDYMTSLYQNQIEENLPVGLIVYENNIPTNVSLIHNVNNLTKKDEFKPFASGRFWAKHLDMPVPLFHLILHCYYLKKIGHITIDAFSYCWDNYLMPKSVLSSLTPTPVKDLSGMFIKTLSGQKNIMFLEKRFAKIHNISSSIKKAQAIVKLKNDADTTFVGDSYYNSIRKNFVTFLKHVGVIDSTGNLTDEGFKLYHLGVVNGPKSKIFQDYFTQTVLIVGHHLDLIFDLDNLCNHFRGKKSIKDIKGIMENEYELKGMIKRNLKRQVNNTTNVEFLKYEFILWNALDLLVQVNGKPEKSFNWKKITEICSLPAL